MMLGRALANKLGQKLAFGARTRSFSSRVQQIGLEELGNRECKVTVQTHDGVFTSLVRAVDDDFQRRASAIADLQFYMKGLDPTDQNGIDMLMVQMDGSGDRSTYGKDVMLGLSMASARAGAVAMDGMPLLNYLSSLGLPLEQVSIPKTMFALPGGIYSIIPLTTDGTLESDLKFLKEMLQHLEQKAPEDISLNDVEKLGEETFVMGVNNIKKCHELQPFPEDLASKLLDMILNHKVLVWADPRIGEGSPIDAVFRDEKLIKDEQWAASQTIVCGHKFSSTLDEFQYAIENEIGNTSRVNAPSFGTVTETIDAVKRLKTANRSFLVDTENWIDYDFIGKFSISQRANLVSIVDGVQAVEGIYEPMYMIEEVLRKRKRK